MSKKLNPVLQLSLARQRIYPPLINEGSADLPLAETLLVFAFQIHLRILLGEVFALKYMLKPDQLPMGDISDAPKSAQQPNHPLYLLPGKQKLEAFLLLHVIEYNRLTQRLGTSMTAGNENRAKMTVGEEVSDIGEVRDIVQAIKHY